MIEAESDSTRVRDIADKGAARHSFPIELDVDVMEFGHVRGEGHEAATASHDLHVVRHFALVDGNF